MPATTSELIALELRERSERGATTQPPSSLEPGATPFVPPLLPPSASPLAPPSAPGVPSTGVVVHAGGAPPPADDSTRTVFRSQSACVSSRV